MKRDRRIEIEPLPQAVRIVESGRLHVARSENELETVTAAQTRKVVELLRTGSR